MSKSERLLALLQLLRRHRRPVTGAALAAELAVSKRTVYRDVDALRAQGAPIVGEAGTGYLLRPGFLLPPLMFTPEELDALSLGLMWVTRRADGALGAAARDALGKITAVLPDGPGEALSAPTLQVGPSPEDGRRDGLLLTLRDAARRERRVELDYTDAKGVASRRVVWPLTLGFFEGHLIVLAAWCEIRGDFRHFRLDRIAAARPTGDPFPRPRRLLLAEWRRALHADRS